MGARRARTGAHSKARIASEAARLFVEQGLPDFRSAKRKAVELLRLNPAAPLPSDEVVEREVGEYLRLFRSQSQPALLTRLRQVSLKLMKQLQDFSPKLVGPVLSGLADEDSVICLHVAADPPEAMQWFLMDRRIRFELDEVRLPLSGGKFERLPSYWIEFQGVNVELVVLSERLRRQTPLAARDGRVLERAGIAEVEALLDATAAASPGRGADAHG